MSNLSTSSEAAYNIPPQVGTSVLPDRTLQGISPQVGTTLLPDQVLPATSHSAVGNTVLKDSVLPETLSSSKVTLLGESTANPVGRPQFGTSVLIGSMKSDFDASRQKTNKK